MPDDILYSYPQSWYPNEVDDSYRRAESGRDSYDMLYMPVWYECSGNSAIVPSVSHGNSGRAWLNHGSCEFPGAHEGQHGRSCSPQV